MLVTIVVPDNIVSIDGRTLPVDCSAIDGNIRVVQWYGTFGEVEFMNEPGKTFKANGRLDSVGDFQDAIDTWQALAAKIDAVPVLQATTPQQAIEMIAQIEATPELLEAPLDEAAVIFRKIQIDGDLDVNALGLDECVRLYNIIQNEPKLLAVYPGLAVQTLQKIEADPSLSTMPLADAVEQVLNPPVPETPTLELQANPQTQQLRKP